MGLAVDCCSGSTDEALKGELMKQAYQCEELKTPQFKLA